MRLYHDIDYVGSAGTGANGRYEKIGKFIESGEPVEMPEACLTGLNPGTAMTSGVYGSFFSGLY